MKRILIKLFSVLYQRDCEKPKNISSSSQFPAIIQTNMLPHEVGKELEIPGFNVWTKKCTELRLLKIPSTGSNNNNNTCRNDSFYVVILLIFDSKTKWYVA